MFSEYVIAAISSAIPTLLSNGCNGRMIDGSPRPLHNRIGQLFLPPAILLKQPNDPLNLSSTRL